MQTECKRRQKGYFKSYIHDYKAIQDLLKTAKEPVPNSECLLTGEMCLITSEYSIADLGDARFFLQNDLSVSSNASTEGSWKGQSLVK